MDILRGQDSHMDALDALDGNYAIDDESDAGLERPPAIGTDERRMQVRAYNYWARMLGDKDYPLVEELDPAETLDFGKYSVLLDFKDGIENPRIAYLGQAIADECDLKGKADRLDQVHPRSLLSRITDHYMQIHANKVPIGFEAEFVNQRDATILYRGILLPFSSTGKDLDYMYGVINWKEAVEGEEAAALKREVDDALDSLDTNEPAMPAWADGPILNDDPPPLELADSFAFDDLSEPGDQDSLHDWLHAARAAAEAAETAEKRSRQALYDAVSRAYDFALIAESDVETYDALLDDAGLKAQPRAPYTPLVKLIFGFGYDKTRIAEIAALIEFGRKQGIALGECRQWIDGYKGGIKAIVADARAERQPTGFKGKKRGFSLDAYRQPLRELPARSIADFSGEGGEVLLLVGRRNEAGEVELVGAIEDEEKLIEAALKKVIS